MDATILILVNRQIFKHSLTPLPVTYKWEGKGKGLVLNGWVANSNPLIRKLADTDLGGKCVCISHTGLLEM